MIVSFMDDETRRVFDGLTSKKLPRDIQRVARRKLFYLDSAHDLRDLLAPPGNRLEALKSGRIGQHSIRINDQWRTCFTWQSHTADTIEQPSQEDNGKPEVLGIGGNAYDVEIVDYH